MSIIVKILNLILLTLLASCSILKRDQGSYGAMIFDKPEFSPGQPPILVKDKRLILWSESCSFFELNLENHYKRMLEQYKKESSEHMVGIADVKIETYTKVLAITALPCMRVEAKPFIVKSWGRINNDSKRQPKGR
jgi:hypothetical protein